MYLADKQGLACERTPGPQKMELLLQLGTHTFITRLWGTHQVPDVVLGPGKPQGQARRGPCSHRAYSLAKRQSRNREYNPAYSCAGLGAYRHLVFYTHVTEANTMEKKRQENEKPFSVIWAIPPAAPLPEQGGRRA